MFETLWVVLFCLVLSCLVLFCFVLLCSVLSCHVSFGFVFGVCCDLCSVCFVLFGLFSLFCFVLFFVYLCVPGFVQVAVARVSIEGSVRKS